MMSDKEVEFRIMTSAELDAECREEARILRNRMKRGRATWGRWRWNPKPKNCPSLDIIVPGIANAYYVEWESPTVAWIGDWSRHLAEKTWITEEDIGHFVRAVLDVGRVLSEGEK